MCTYTQMTKYVENKWNELKTHVTKLVSDMKSTETTEKLKADYNAKFSMKEEKRCLRIIFRKETKFLVP